MWRRTWLVFSQAVTVAMALLFVVLTLKPEWLPRGATTGMLPSPTIVQVVQPPRAPDVNGSLTMPASLSLAPAAQRASPAVVSVRTTRGLRPGSEPPPQRLPFGHPQLPGPTRHLGSAVIVAPEGYLLTNHHVVENAVEIEVQLADGRQALAQIVGSDPDTDLALLKIDLPDLPVITLGDMRSLLVGDPVLAIGNPFGVGLSVTSGIVSALDRTSSALLGNTVLRPYIQTDAAINPGNSGGALVDAQGNLVGINTAIYARGGGANLGIGFAVPVDTAREVMEILLREGQVRRGWIGVETRDLTPELAEVLGVPLTEGVLIIGVLNNGPAALAGLRPGDVVTEIAGRPVGDGNDLLASVAGLAPLSRAEVRAQRGAESLLTEVTVAQRPPNGRP
jgi:serine protease DegQ